jgi:hypothetical protein
MISPEETPAWSLFPHENVDSKHPEWSTDTLRTPVSTNQVFEGEEYTYTQFLPTTRIGNFTEIALQTYQITRTDEIVSKAGPKSELGRQRRKAGLELKQDMELSILANKGSAVGADTVTTRKSAGFAAWVTTNDQRSVGGADGGFIGPHVAAATNGTTPVQRAFTKQMLDAAILSCYTNGGSPTVLMVSPYIKTVFSTFINIANTSVIQSNVRGKDQAVIYSAADTYNSDFGIIDVMPNRQLARGGATMARNAYLIDLSKVAVGILDDLFEDKPAKTGDNEKRALLCEFTLIMKNEAAHSVIADLFGMGSAA